MIEDLYHHCELNKIPKYLLNDKKFMINRIFYKKEKIHYRDLINKHNPFNNDKDFFLDLFKLYNSIISERANKNIFTMEKSSYIFRLANEIISFISNFLRNENKILNHIIKKYSFVILFGKHNNDDKNFIKSVYKNKQTRLITSVKVKFDHPLFKPDDVENQFELLKNISFVINKTNFFPDNKILLNLISTRKNLSRDILIKINDRKLILQLTKTNKYYSSYFSGENHNFTFVKFSILKYGFSKWYYIVVVRKVIHLNKFLDIHMLTDIDDFNKIKYCDILYSLVHNHKFDRNVFIYMGNTHKTVYKNKYLMKKILNKKKFESIKLIFKYLYFNNKNYDNDNYINDLKNFFLRKRIINKNFKINLLKKFFIYNFLNSDCTIQWYNNVIEFIEFDKKILEKIFYYYPEFINNIHLPKINIYESKMINYKNIFIKKVPSCIGINSNELKRFVNNQNSIHFLSDIFNKNEIINYYSKIDFGILNHLPHFKKDKDIVSLSLQKNEEMIKYSDVEYINKYIENNFDINKTIEEIEKV